MPVQDPSWPNAYGTARIKYKSGRVFGRGYNNGNNNISTIETINDIKKIMTIMAWISSWK